MTNLARIPTVLIMIVCSAANNSVSGMEGEKGKQNLPSESSGAGNSYVQRVKPAVLAWLESVRNRSDGWGRWKYHSTMERPYSLQASGQAISILHMLGTLDSITDEQRSQAIAFINSCQDPSDRLFKDPLEDESCYTGHHTWEQVWAQRNGAALAALQLLDAGPSLPQPDRLFVDLRTVDGADWTLNEVDWTNPWKNGEGWSREIIAYCKSLPLDTSKDQDPLLTAAFLALESEVLDPETGMPSRRMPKEKPSVAMAGLFKVMNGYLAAERPIPYAKQAIDTTLALQREDGEFGSGNNMCLNWDAIWVLRELDRQLHGSHRHSDIVAAGNRCAVVLLERYRKPDGGFSFHADHCKTNHHSIRLCDRPLPISDTMGTVMCLRCLSYVDEWNGVVKLTAGGNPDQPRDSLQ